MPPSSEASDPADPALQLHTLRLAQLHERRREGLWLLGWGLLNTATFAVLARVKRDDPAVLAGSVTSLSFGAINAALAPGLLDLSHARRRAIDRDQNTNDPHREAAGMAQAELRSGQAFALNAGLDIAYMTAGALLFALGRAHRPHEAWAEGAGVAMLGQGGFLFAFDVTCWRHANRRAMELSRLR